MWDYGRDMRKVVALTLEKSGITKENFSDIETIDSNILARNYAEAYHELEGPGVEYFGPTKSEDYIGEPFHNGFTEHAKAAPLIVGSNFSEFSNLPKQYNRNKMSDEEMIKAVEDFYGKEKADEIIPLFQKAFPTNKIIDILAYDRTTLRQTVLDLIKTRIDAGCAETYNYHFDPIFRINDGCTALHSSDIVFMFRNIDMVPSTYMGEGVAEGLQHQMADRLLAFAKTGKPNLEGEFEWKPCTADTTYTMRFTENSELKENFDKELLEKMSGLKELGR